MSLPKQLSPSSIDCWRLCPRRFYYQEIERLPFEESYSYQQLLGLVVHGALESLMRLDPSVRAEQVSAHVERGARRQAVRVPTTAHDVQGAQEMLQEEARALVEPYVIADGADVRPLKLEQRFQLRLKGGTVIKTRVDRIDKTASGLLRIVDYKTGRHQIDERDLARESAPVVQLLAVGRASETPIERITWTYLRSGESISWWPEEDDVEEAAEWIVKLLRDIHRDREFVPNPGVQCSSCSFTEICPATARTAANERQPIRRAA